MATSVDEFVQTRVLPEYREIVEAVRELMRACAPEAQEVLSYGIPAYRVRRLIVHISPTKRGITVAFARGASFEDRYGLLEGVGKVSKNVRIRRMDAFPTEALRDYIRQALALEAQHDG